MWTSKIGFLVFGSGNRVTTQIVSTAFRPSPTTSVMFTEIADANRVHFHPCVQEKRCSAFYSHCQPHANLRITSFSVAEIDKVNRSWEIRYPCHRRALARSRSS